MYVSLGQVEKPSVRFIGMWFCFY